MMRFLRELNTHLQIRADPLYRYLRVFVSGQEPFTRKTTKTRRHSARNVTIGGRHNDKIYRRENIYTGSGTGAF